MSYGFIVINHTTPVVGQFYFFRGLSWLVNTTEIAVDGSRCITSIRNGGNEVAGTFCIVATGEETRVTGHPGLAVNKRNAPFIDLEIEVLRGQPGAIACLTESRDN